MNMLCGMSQTRLERVTKPTVMSDVWCHRSSLRLTAPLSIEIQAGGCAPATGGRRRRGVPRRSRRGPPGGSRARRRPAQRQRRCRTSGVAVQRGARAGPTARVVGQGRAVARRGPRGGCCEAPKQRAHNKQRKRAVTHCVSQSRHHHLTPYGAHPVNIECISRGISRQFLSTVPSHCCRVKGGVTRPQSRTILMHRHSAATTGKKQSGRRSQDAGSSKPF